MTIKQEYLGDGVYAEYDGFHITLTAENGFGLKSKIYLDGDVIEALFYFIKRIKESKDHSS